MATGRRVFFVAGPKVEDVHVSSRYEYLDGHLYTQTGTISYEGEDSFKRNLSHPVRLVQIIINLTILISQSF